MYSIVPQPKNFEIISSEICFRLSGGIKIFYGSFEKAYQSLYRFVFDEAALAPEEAPSGSIVFEKIDSFAFEEYSILVEDDKICICASSDNGAFLAVQSLKQLFISSNLSLCKMKIEDEPVLNFRALMLDSARHFFEVGDLFALLDIMAMFKLNVLHLHLSDDQGWRLELYSKLKLAQIGGFRASTNFNITSHGGFYSVEDIEKIIQYASDRFIQIIPELDTPAHTMAMIAAYPHLSCLQREVQVATHSGVKHEILCPGRDETFEFVQSVWNETIDMFKPEYIHIGADEVVPKRWQLCPKCRQRMVQIGAENAEELLPYYVNRINASLKSKAKIICWGSKMSSKYDKNIIPTFWGKSGEEEEFFLQHGNNAFINGCSSAYYFDMPHSIIGLTDTYEYDPFEYGNILGIECFLWSEYITDFSSICRHLFPRIFAFAETAWNGKNRPKYEKFIKKLDDMYFLLDAYGIQFTKLKSSNPKGIKSAVQTLAFEKRRLHWQPLHIHYDDKAAQKLFQNKKQ